MDHFLCKKLATIKRDVELKHGLEEMKVGRVDTKKLREWYTELESLMGKVWSYVKDDGLLQRGCRR